MRKPLLLLLAATLPLAAQTAAKPALRILIVTGNSDEPYHHWRETTAGIRDALNRTGRFAVRVNEEPRGITASALEGYDALAINYNGPRWPAAAEAAVESFVSSGKGLAAFHLACYGPFFGMEFRDRRWRSGPAGAAWTAFPQMIGASWDAEKIGHARRSVFQVDWIGTHAINRGLQRSFMVNDELYQKLTLAPATQVLADAMSPADIGGTGRREPMIWVSRFGNGRTFFTTLGHDAEAWYQPGMIDAFVRGVEWAATGEATVAPSGLHPSVAGAHPIRMLVVTGGHQYPNAFYGMLKSLPGVAWTHAATPEEAFGRPLEDRFDVILFHDMRETASAQMRARLTAYLEAGKGVISLHHAIVDYTDWPYWYQEVIGGKYFTKEAEGHPASHYHEGVEFLVTPVRGKEAHPVLRGVGPLWVHDEAYRRMFLSPKIEVLMETKFRENDAAVVYVGPHRKARVVYIQLGHSGHTLQAPAFQKLLGNAVEWTARRID